jgi:hypothetical protein
MWNGKRGLQQCLSLLNSRQCHVAQRDTGLVGGAHICNNIFELLRSNCGIVSIPLAIGQVSVEYSCHTQQSQPASCPVTNCYLGAQTLLKARSTMPRTKPFNLFLRPSSTRRRFGIATELSGRGFWVLGFGHTSRGAFWHSNQAPPKGLIQTFWATATTTTTQKYVYPS